MPTLMRGLDADISNPPEWAPSKPINMPLVLGLTASSFREMSAEELGQE